ncbi:MAG: HAD family phosphatase [Clostridiales bacterium]|jgi:putative hydrolase of the HAD superfamily|nr:HAD family phosphatase [Clostridiales bacterium]
MIKNIIFDQGGVLVDYTPKDYLRANGFSEERVEALYEAVFNAPLWLELDRGTYTNKEAIPVYIKEHPEFEKEIGQVLSGSLETMLTVREDSSSFLKQLKEEGFRIYVLSNFSADGYDYILPRFDYLNYVDEKIISAHIHMIKPEKEIYEYTVEKLGIVPEESIFIDDVPENLLPAEALGIHTVLFTTLPEVVDKVRAIINAQ